MTIFNIPSLLEEFEKAEVYEDDGGGFVKSVYLGSCFSLLPSGKFYTAWATSNLDPCPQCNGSGDTKNPTGNSRIHKRVEKRLKVLVRKALDRFGTYHSWPKNVRDQIDRNRKIANRTQPTVSCVRCDGCGSHEAADDERWREKAEAELSEHGFWLHEGEGDPTDIFVGMSVPDPEEEEEEGEVEVEEVKTEG